MRIDNLNNLFNDLNTGKGLSKTTIFNLNHTRIPDVIPVNELKLRDVEDIVTDNKKDFNKFLVQYVLKHSVMLAESNVYIQVTRFKNEYKFELLEEPDPLPGLRILLGNIDWKELREDKLKVLETLGEIGLIFFLDHIQDIAVEYNFGSEKNCF